MLIGEKATQSGLDTVGHHWGIPVVELMSSHMIAEGAAYESLPTLPFSQPGVFVKDLHRPQTFLEKLSHVPDLFGIVTFLTLGGSCFLL